MFNFFKKKEKPGASASSSSIRETLFGDMPIAQWASDLNATAEPWGTFVQVRKCLEAGDQASAIAALQRITEMPVLEPRHYLQAWHFLRSLGVNPPANQAKLVYGVIVEIGYKTGFTLIAVYANFTARYFPYNGGGVVWERPDKSLDGEIQTLFSAAQAVANKIGPWEGDRPGPPPADNMRLNMLTPSGLHFGYGGVNTLRNEPMGKAIIEPAMQLMLSLSKKANQ